MHLNRNCPICNVGLNIRMVEEVEIDECPKCHGVYLDHGEIKKITNNSKLHRYFMGSLGNSPISPLLCPGCGGSMRLQYIQETEVDTCANCKGIWLDPGELHRISGIIASDIPEGAPEGYNPKPMTLEEEARKMELERKRSKSGGSSDGLMGKLISVFRHE